MKKRKALDDEVEVPIRTITPPINCISNNYREEVPVELLFSTYNKQLVCIDWDGTISRGNSHNQAMGKRIPVKDETKGVKVFDIKSHVVCQEAINFAISYYYDREAAFNNVNSLHHKMVMLIEMGVNIAIVTYNEFPDIIVYGLKQIGFNNEQMSKIHIIYNFPVGVLCEVGKTQHIEIAKKLYGVKDNKNVTLVEDSEINTLIAQKQGIECYLVTANNSFRFMKDVIQIVQCKEQDFLPEVRLCSSPFSLIGSQELLHNKCKQSDHDNIALSKREFIALPTQKLEKASNTPIKNFTPNNINPLSKIKTTINFFRKNSYKEDIDEDQNVSPIAKSTAEFIFTFDDDTEFLDVLGDNSLDFL